MTDQRTTPVTGPVPTEIAADHRQIRAALAVVALLAVVGCALGPIWSWWSPPGPLGEQIPSGVIADETEAFIAADGRFALLTAAVGLVAALACWALRSVRGPWIAAALAVGGVIGAVLTDVIGHLVRGGGQPIPVTRTIARINHLPLQVHATGLLLVEAALAALVYALFVAFTAHDDLGRGDPIRVAARRSAEAGGQPDGGGGDGDAAGAPQQREFPAQ
jgi:hypothetical protein